MCFLPTSRREERYGVVFWESSRFQEEGRRATAGFTRSNWISLHPPNERCASQEKDACDSSIQIWAWPFGLQAAQRAATQVWGTSACHLPWLDSKGPLFLQSISSCSLIPSSPIQRFSRSHLLASWISGRSTRGRIFGLRLVVCLSDDILCHQFLSTNWSLSL
jgi:hypothetical protein